MNRYRDWGLMHSRGIFVFLGSELLMLCFFFLCNVMDEDEAVVELEADDEDESIAELEADEEDEAGAELEAVSDEAFVGSVFGGGRGSPILWGIG